MQEFASKCCQHNAAQPPATSCIMNADGVYLATYSALLLTLKQRRINYYINPEVSKCSVFKVITKSLPFAKILSLNPSS